MKLIKTIILIISISFYSYSQEGWIEISPDNNYDNFHGAIYPINKDTIFSIYDNGILFRTYNGGDDWIEFNTNIDTSIYDLVFYNIDTGYTVGANGVIGKTTNKGSSWSILQTGTNKNITSIFINSANNIWAVGDSGIILNSFDYGNSWNIIDTLSENNLNSVSFKNSTTGYIAGDNGTLLYTNDGGSSWISINTGYNDNLSSISLTENYIYILAGIDKIIKSNDNSIWTSIINYNCSKIFFTNDSLGYNIKTDMLTKCNGGYIWVYKTVEFGENYTQSLSKGVSDYVGEISDLHFITDSIGFAMSSHYILKTIDGGSFTEIINNVEKINNENFVKIYPNPTYNELNIFTTNKIDFVKILDINGKIVLYEKNQDNNIKLNISKLKPGTYFITLEKDKVIYKTAKFIKN